MKNTYVSVNTYGGMDWHDTKTWSKFLTENNRFELTNPMKAIAKHVYKELQDMYTSCTQNGKTTKTVLNNIPSLDEIAKHIAEKESFSVTSKDGYELEAYWNPEENQLTMDYFAGQVSYDIAYEIMEIESDNLIYIAAQNFLCPMKGVPSVTRFYTKPFDNLADAQKECERIQASIDSDNVRAELILADKTVMCNTEWYKSNNHVIELLKAHPELNTPENFKLLVKEHAKALEQKIA